MLWLLASYGKIIWKGILSQILPKSVLRTEKLNNSLQRENSQHHNFLAIRRKKVVKNETIKTETNTTKTKEILLSDKVYISVTYVVLKTGPLLNF